MCIEDDKTMTERLLLEKLRNEPGALENLVKHHRHLAAENRQLRGRMGRMAVIALGILLDDGPTPEASAEPLQ